MVEPSHPTEYVRLAGRQTVALRVHKSLTSRTSENADLVSGKLFIYEPLVEKEADKADKERNAICCYSVLLAQGEQTGKMLLRFVDGRPVSQVTCDYLAWFAEKMAALGKTALVLIVGIQ